MPRAPGQAVPPTALFSALGYAWQCISFHRRISLPVLAYTVNLVRTGLGALAAYLAAHVLLCLLPAFFIAGRWRR
jgi:hypothetical protein